MQSSVQLQLQLQHSAARRGAEEECKASERAKGDQRMHLSSGTSFSSASHPLFLAFLPLWLSVSLSVCVPVSLVLNFSLNGRLGTLTWLFFDF